MTNEQLKDAFKNVSDKVISSQACKSPAKETLNICVYGIFTMLYEIAIRLPEGKDGN